MCDVFEDRTELIPWRTELFDLIRQTPNLDWLLLTKRPENIRQLMEKSLIVAEGGDPEDEPETDLGCWLNDWTGDDPPVNVWLGATVECQDVARDLSIS